MTTENAETMVTTIKANQNNFSIEKSQIRCEIKEGRCDSCTIEKHCTEAKDHLLFPYIREHHPELLI